MKLTEIQKAYLAGFLDADGSIYVRAKPNSTYRFGYQIAPYIVFYQSSKSVLFEKVCTQIGVGRKRVRKDGVTEYIIGKQEEILDFLNSVEPYLILKKEQSKILREILKIKESVVSRNDFQRILTLCNQFSNLNYSKKRKIRTLSP